MKRLLAAIVGICLISGSVHAFEQTGSGKAEQSQAKPGSKKLNLDTSTTATLPKADGGTVVRIPGLGMIGVLPKLDFGLELLYGDAQPRAIEPRRDDADADSDGLRIRGTLKHRF